MSVHRVSPFASKAATVVVILGVDVMLGAAAAQSDAQALPSSAVSTDIGESQSGSRAVRPAGSCRVISRPKHMIVDCDCSDPLAGVASVDVAAMLRLIVGNPACRASASPRT
jgi:hypothetical protein